MSVVEYRFEIPLARLACAICIFSDVKPLSRICKVYPSIAYGDIVRWVGMAAPEAANTILDQFE